MLVAEFRTHRVAPRIREQRGPGFALLIPNLDRSDHGSRTECAGPLGPRWTMASLLAPLFAAAADAGACTLLRRYNE